MTQQPVDGASLVPPSRTRRPRSCTDTQYFEMMGSRFIYHEGWKATTDHIITGVLDEEELAVGSRTSTTTAGDSPTSRRILRGDRPRRRRAGRLERIRELWDAEAERNHVLPISDGLTTVSGDSSLRSGPRARPVRSVPAAALSPTNPSLCYGVDSTHGRHRDRPRGARRGRLRPRRLVRGLRALPRRWAGPLHLRPSGRRTRAGDATALGAGRHTLAVGTRCEGEAAGGMALLVDGRRSTPPWPKACSRWQCSTAAPDCVSAGTAASRCPRVTRRRPLSEERCTRSGWTRRARPTGFDRRGARRLHAD